MALCYAVHHRTAGFWTLYFMSYDFATLSHTQELEWKKMRTWPCTGSGEVQKNPNSCCGKLPSLGERLPWCGRMKKSWQCFEGRAALSCPVPSCPVLVGGRCTGWQWGDPELPTSRCGSDASLCFPHLLLLFFKSVGGK